MSSSYIVRALFAFPPSHIKNTPPWSHVCHSETQENVTARKGEDVHVDEKMVWYVKYKRRNDISVM